jgi:signal transduction histidine kinase
VSNRAGYGPPWRDPDRWWGNPHRARRGHGVRLALLVGLIQVVGTRVEAGHVPGPAYLLLLAGPLALLFRARHRVPVVAVTVAVTLAYLVLGYPYGPVVLAPLVAVLGALRAGYRAPVWGIVLAGYVVDVVLGRLPGVHLRAPGVVHSLLMLFVIGVVFLVGEAARVQSRYLTEFARARAEQQRRQASEERLRIAQELHDVLGHHLSLINVQAGVGLHLMDEQPEQARTALVAIKDASAEALREVRSVLGILRSEDESAPRTPAPSLANLPSLVEDAGATASVDGPARELPAEVDRAAYRIAQEALTNVRRHAGPGATAAVLIGYDPDALTVRVRDDGVGGPPVEDGNGIAGMRARAAALGGTLTAGPADGGGYLVEARLPLK